MNSRRLLSTLLLGSSLGLASFAQLDDLAALRAKAEKGNAVAQYNLGLAYAEGRGTTPDAIEAFVWLTLAGEGGARGRALDALAATLSPSQLQTARARLAERRTTLDAAAAPGSRAATTSPAAAPAETDFDRQIEATLVRLNEEKAALQKQLTDAERLRGERDALAVRVTELAADIAALRSERERAQASSEAANQSVEMMKAEITRLREALTAAQAGQTAPAANIAALEKKNREITATLEDLQNSQNASAQLAEQLARATEDRARLEQMLNTAQTGALEAGREIEALRKQLQAASAAPTYPDLRERVTALETMLERARARSTPAYPDLRERVTQLEEQNRTLQAAAPSYPDLREQVATLERDLAAARSQANTPPAAPDLSPRVRELETQLAELSAKTAPAAPAYPDLRSRVADLEARLAAAATPAYPDLSGRVAELEQQLAASQANPQPTQSSESDAAAELQKRLAETEDKLATSLRAYTLLKNERDEAAAKAGATSAGLESDKSTLTTQLNDVQGQVEAAKAETAAAQAEIAQLKEAYAALERSTADGTRELAAARALLQQQQGANATLAQENYQLKTALARDPNASRRVVNAIPRETPPPATADARTVHTVVGGDSLSKISQLYYGTPSRWQEIYNANRAILGPTGALSVGTVLRIP